jgi:hypothetical protein
MIPDEHCCIEAGIDAFNHRKTLGTSTHQLGRRVEIFGKEIAHEPVTVVHEDGLCTRLERASDCSVGFISHQTPKPVILSRMAGLNRVGLVFVYDSGDALHIDRDVNPHDRSRVAFRREEY